MDFLQVCRLNPEYLNPKPETLNPKPSSQNPRLLQRAPRSALEASPLKGVAQATWGFPKIRGTILGVPIIRIVIFWVLYWGSLILGNYHLQGHAGVEGHVTTGFQDSWFRTFGMSCDGDRRILRNARGALSLRARWVSYARCCVSAQPRF